MSEQKQAYIDMHTQQARTMVFENKQNEARTQIHHDNLVLAKAEKRELKKQMQERLNDAKILTDNMESTKSIDRGKKRFAHSTLKQGSSIATVANPNREYQFVNLT